MPMFTPTANEVAQHHLEAIWQLTVAHTVAIAHSCETRETVMRPTDEVTAAGTGVCITLGGRYFVATAGHVLLDSADTLIPRHDLTVISVNHRVGRPTALKVRGAGVLGGVSGHPDDLGWLEVDGDSDVDFVEISRLVFSGDLAPDALVALVGYPRHATEFSVTRKLTGPRQAEVDRLVMLEARSFGTNLTPYSGSAPAPSWFDPGSRHLVMHADDRFNPVGMSGGGIWALDPRKVGLWSPHDIRLIGIQISRMGKFLIGQRLSHWLRLLANDVPDLAEAIAAVRAY